MSTAAERAAPRTRRRRGAGLFFAVAAAVALLHGYIGWRLIGGAHLPGVLAGGLSLVLGLLYLSIPGGFFLARMYGGALSSAVAFVGRIWMGGFWIFLSAVFASDLARVIARLALGPAVDALKWDRVQALGAFGAGVLAVAIALWTARRPVLERVRVPLSGLPPALEGLRIVQLSDVHVGELIGRRFLERIVERVNALAPDVVAITGDLVDGTVQQLGPELAPLSGLKAPLGVYYVTGNHEYYWGGPLWERQVRELGLTVLHNEHRLLERGGATLALGGVTDFNGGSFGEEHASRPDRAFAGAPDGAPRVLLAHQPRSVEAAARAGVDLQLSGHTHGGQIFPFNFFVRLQQPVVSGLRKVAGVWVYAHRGTGFWGPPMRLGPTPEIAELTLVTA